MVIDRDNFVPIYYQIGEKIRSEIDGGALPPGAKLPTEEELAKLYAVSRNTIRGCLDKLAKEGYVKSVKGKGTFVAGVPGRHKLICVLISNFNIKSHMFAQALVSSILETAHEVDAFAQVCDLDHLPALLDAVKAGRQTIDGFVAVRCLHNRPELLKLIDQAGIPVVIEGDSSIADHSFVEIDNVKGMEKIVSHLLGLGHRSFGVCGSPMHDSIHFKVRNDATRRSLHAALGPEADISSFNFSGSQINGVYEEAAQMLRRPKLPTAFVCLGDSIALGLERRALDMGFSVPEDFSITGFDDWHACEIVRPALTTVRQDYYQMGRLATEKLFGMIGDYKNRTLRVMVDPELVIRESTAAPRRIKESYMEAQYVEV